MLTFSMTDGSRLRDTRTAQRSRRSQHSTVAAAAWISSERRLVLLRAKHSRFGEHKNRRPQRQRSRGLAPSFLSLAV